MGKEIEIKIPLTDSEYDKIFEEIRGRAEHLKKSDEYYSKYDSREERIKNNEPPVIRIRTVGLCPKVFRGQISIFRIHNLQGLEVLREIITIMEQYNIIQNNIIFRFA